MAFAQAAAAAVPGLAVMGAHSPPPPVTSSGGGGDGKGRGQEGASVEAKPSSSPYYLTPESYAPMCYVARRRRPHPKSTQTLTRVSPFEVRICSVYIFMCIYVCIYI